MNNEKPRYSRITDIIDLAIFMQSKPLGITINDIMKRYGVARRTAERMRDSLMNTLPQVEEIETTDSCKHWGFVNYTLSQLISFSPKEIANIEQLQRRTTNKEIKKELLQTIEKLKALNNKNLNALESNIELYMQTEGYAIRQTPQYEINLETLTKIRNALQTHTKVTAVYHERNREIEPLGLIYGEKIYLIAREKAKGDGIYNYLLHKFENVKNTNESFDRKNFDLQEYSKRSFGVYQGEILHVELLFEKELAEDAKRYNFHPTQKITQNSDGTVTVEFDASGKMEIMWHIFRWGEKCKIVAPEKLASNYKDYLQKCLKNYK